MTTAKDIRELTKKQQVVLSQICVNDDRGHHPRTFDGRGWIAKKELTLL